ncbi:MAG: T9SS type A sorting domain-containing protein [Saprospiraceae bacterium]|nr:T9SS type A sorting domain-containing protein [Saprospiraceae bacterium]
MKVLKFIIAAGILFIKGMVFTQSNLPELEWSGIQPLWTYVSEDPYFIKEPTDPYSSKYSHKHLVEQDVYDNHLYILESTFSQSPDFGPDGCLLHKLDLKNGKPEFIYYTGVHKDEKYREHFINGRMRYLPDSKEIELSGFRDFAPRGNFSIFGFYGHPVIRRVDTESGELKETATFSDTTFRNYIAFAEQNIPLSDGNYLYFYYKNRIENDTLKQDLVFVPFDNNGSVLSAGGSVLTFSSGLRTQLLNFFELPRIKLINDTTIMAVIQVINPADIEGVRLISSFSYLKINSDLSISLDKTIDLLPLQKWTADRRNYLANHSVNSQIFIFNSIDIEFFNSYPLGINWLDEKGNIVAEINRLQTNDNGYYHIIPLMVKNDKTFILAIGEKSGYVKMDLFEILPGINNFIKIANLNLLQEGEELIKVQKAGIYDDLLYIGVRVESKIRHSTFGTLHYHYGFDARALGLVSAVEDMPEVVHVQMYPNPVTDRLSVRLGSDVQGQTVAECTDITGNVVYRRQVDTREFQWDMSALPQGMYFVRLKQGDRMVYTGKVVKM